MSIFDSENKITPKYLQDKYNASLDKESVYRIKMYAVFRGTKLWVCRSTITINIDHDSLFIICPDKSIKIKGRWYNLTRMKYKIYNISDLDFIIQHYKDVLYDYAESKSGNYPIDICFGDGKYIRWLGANK